MFKKVFTLVIFTFYFVPSFSQTVEYGGLKWYTDYHAAKEKAIKEHKNIVILFTGSDWCPPCMALKKEVFHNPIFQKETRNVVLVLADFPRRKRLSDEQARKNKLLATRFLGRGGLPTMIALDPVNEEIIDRIVGYNFYKHDIQPHVEFIKKAAKSIN